MSNDFLKVPVVSIGYIREINIIMLRGFGDLFCKYDKTPSTKTPSGVSIYGGRFILGK